MECYGTPKLKIGQKVKFAKLKNGSHCEILSLSITVTHEIIVIGDTDNEDTFSVIKMPLTADRPASIPKTPRPEQQEMIIIIGDSDEEDTVQFYQT